MTKSEKFKALAYALRSRAVPPGSGPNRNEALAMAERFETYAREAAETEEAEIKRLFGTAA